MLKLLMCFFAALILLPLMATPEYSATISRDGVNIKKGIDLSLFSRFIAMEPPWNECYFMTAWWPATSERHELEGRAYKSDLKLEKKPENFRFKAYYVEVNEEEVVVSLSVEALENIPASIEYSALMIPENLIRSATFTATQANGKVIEGVIPEAWTKRAVPLAENVTKMVFHCPLGEYVIEVLSGRPLLIVDRRGFGFDLGVDTSTPGIWVGIIGNMEAGESLDQKLRVKFDLKSDVKFTEPLPQLPGMAEVVDVAMLVSMPEALPRSLPVVKNRIITADKPLASTAFKLGLHNLPPEDAAKFDKFIARKLTPAGVDEVRVINIIFNDELADEEYRLVNSFEAVFVEAKNPRGAFYALQTLAADPDTAYEISDLPDFGMRSILIMIDENSLKIHGDMIENLLAPLKMNHLFIECEYAAWDATANIHQPWAMSKEDLAALIKIANDNYIEVTPLFQTLGHCGWLFKNGQNMEMAENSKADVYNALHPGVHPLMERVLDEIMVVFNNPKFIHIGHDEIGSENNYPVIPENRAVGGQKIIIDDIMFYYDYAKKHNARIVMWHDMFAKTADPFSPVGTVSLFGLADARRDFPKDIVFAFWNYGENIDTTTLAELRLEGFDVIGCHWYVPANIQNLTRACKENSAMGMMMTIWAGYNGFDKLYEDNSYQVAAYIKGLSLAWNSDEEANDYSEGHELNVRLFSDLSDSVGRGFNIDLSHAANLSLNPELHPFLLEPQLDYDTELLKPLSCAVNFKIAERDGYPAVITLKSRINPMFADSVSIPIGRSATTLYFLQTMRSPGIELFPGTQIAEYIVHYVNGEEVAIPVRLNKEIAFLESDYNVHLPKFRCAEWLSDNGIIVRNWYFRWKNPHPELEIESIVVRTLSPFSPFYLLGISAQ